MHQPAAVASSSTIGGAIGARCHAVDAAASGGRPGDGGGGGATGNAAVVVAERARGVVREKRRRSSFERAARAASCDQNAAHAGDGMERTEPRPRQGGEGAVRAASATVPRARVRDERGGGKER